MMPEMSGFEVLERIKTTHATSKVPVIMVTAKMQDEDVLTGYQHGADYYITKPCTAKQLLYGIGLVLDRVEAAAGEAVERAEPTRSRGSGTPAARACADRGRRSGRRSRTGADESRFDKRRRSSASRTWTLARAACRQRHVRRDGRV